MSEDIEARQFVVLELSWLEGFLCSNFGFSVGKVKRIIKEVWHSAT